MPRRAALSLVLLAASGCYSSRAVSGGNLRALAKPTDDGAVLPGADGPDTRLDPNSMVRFHRADGSVTRWFPARHLRVAPGGALLSFAFVPVSVLGSVRVTGLPEAHRKLLSDAAPGGSRLESQADGALRLHAPEGALGAWLADFHVRRQRTFGPEETWHFQPPGTSAARAVPGEALGQVLRQGVVVVDGLGWDDIRSAEVRNFDGFATWFALVTSPLWVSGTLLVAGMAEQAGVRVMDDVVEGLTESDDVKAAPEAPVPDELVTAGGVLGPGAIPPPDASRSRPLFTEVALRRARLRPLFWLGGGGELSDGTASSAEVGVGVRLQEVFEVGVGYRAFWPEPFGFGPYRPGPPLSPGPLRSKSTPTGFVRLGGTFELDAWRRVSLPLAVNVGYGAGELVQARLRYGVRVRLVDQVFVGLYPFNVQFHHEGVTDTGGWTFPSGVEAGVTY